MSFTLLGILNAQAAGVSISYWLSTLGGASNDHANGVATDSQGNLLVVGETDSAGAGTDDCLLVKYDPAGSVQWQRVLGGSAIDKGYSVAIDSADNIYVGGYTYSEGAGSGAFLLAKYNSSGTLQWQRIVGGENQEISYAIAVDSSDDIYMVGHSETTIGTYTINLYLVKYNSGGTLQWQKTLGSTSQVQRGYGIITDSSDNAYITGQTGTASANNEALLAKYNSSGTIQWQRTLGAASDDETGRAMALDSNEDIYLTGDTESQGAGAKDFLLAKYNSSGTLQWQRTLGAAGNGFGESVAVDSSDNVYVCGREYTNNELLLAKYNSSGTIQWQRTLGAASNLILGYGVAIDASDTVCVTGETNATGAGNYDFFTAKLPNDGSLTGSYTLDGVSITYASSSFTAATSTLTSSTSSLNSLTDSLSAATSTLTAASASLTAHLVEL